MIRKTIRGNKNNWQREAIAEAYDKGCVRIQQPGNPVDVVLLTPHQIRVIMKLSQEMSNDG